MCMLRGPFSDLSSCMSTAERMANEQQATVYLVHHVDEVGRPWFVYAVPPSDQPSAPVKPA
jgi:hypothetical protein